MNIKKYAAEFLGTFVLVTFGCGTAVAANSIFISLGSPIPAAFTTLLIALAFGLCIYDRKYFRLSRQSGGIAGDAAVRQDER